MNPPATVRLPQHRARAIFRIRLIATRQWALSEGGDAFLREKAGRNVPLQDARPEPVSCRRTVGAGTPRGLEARRITERAEGLGEKS